MKNVTLKQLTTLTVLVCILFIVIAVQYFFRPVIKEKNELSQQVEDMQSEYENKKLDLSCYDADLSVYQKNRASFEDNRKNLLPLMKSNEIDKMITKIFIEKGLKIESLDIGEIKSDTVSIPYKNDQEDIENDDDKNGEINSECEDTNDDKNNKKIDLSDYPQGVSAVINKNENIMLQYQTGEYSCELNYNVSGTYKDILALVNEITKVSSLQISSFYFINKDTVSADSVYLARIGVTAYMYDSLYQSEKGEDK